MKSWDFIKTDFKEYFWTSFKYAIGISFSVFFLIVYSMESQRDECEEQNNVERCETVFMPEQEVR